MLTQEKSECPPPRDCDKGNQNQYYSATLCCCFIVCVCVFFFVFFFFVLFFSEVDFYRLRKSVKVPSPRCASPFPGKNKNNPRELQDEIGYTFSRALY